MSTRASVLTQFVTAKVARLQYTAAPLRPSTVSSDPAPTPGFALQHEPQANQGPDDGSISREAVQARDSNDDSDAQTHPSEQSSATAATVATSAPDPVDDVWNYSRSVPGSKNGKLIFYMAPFELGPWTREQWHARFVFVKDALEALVHKHLRLLDFENRPTYSPRMVGTCPSDARPAVVVACLDVHFEVIRNLFQARAKEPLCLGRESGLFQLRSAFSSRAERAMPTIPRLLLVYYRTLTHPVTRSALEKPLLVSLGAGSAACGATICYGERSATLSVALKVGERVGILTVDHLFPAKETRQPESPFHADSWYPDEEPSWPALATTSAAFEHGDSDSLWEDDDDYEDLGLADDKSSEPMQLDSGASASVVTSEAEAIDGESMSWQWKVLASSADLAFSAASYLDWALIYPESTTPEHSPQVRLNTIFPSIESEEIALREVQRAPTSNLARVYIVSGIRGILGGRILYASSFLPSRSSQESCEVWTVILDEASGGVLSGESGSIVIDSKTNNVYGHVVGSDPLGHAYVVPIANVLIQLEGCFASCGLADSDWLQAKSNIPAGSNLTQGVAGEPKNITPPDTSGLLQLYRQAVSVRDDGAPRISGTTLSLANDNHGRPKKGKEELVDRSLTLRSGGYWDWYDPFTEYKPLDTSKQEVRLLTLAPADDTSETIRCDLHHASLLDKPSYKALSYTWGDPGFVKPIYLGGTVFHVTANLCAALRRIRDKTEPVTLWVDAVCINQKNNAEKSAQIPLMRTIYASAEEVLVWLGEMDEECDYALMLIQRTSDIIDTRTPDAALRSPLVGGFKDYPAFGSFQRHRALTHFLNRPWWSRVWVVQEVVVSREVTLLCGAKTLPWAMFRNVCYFWLSSGKLDWSIVRSSLERDDRDVGISSLERDDYNMVISSLERDDGDVEIMGSNAHKIMELRDLWRSTDNETGGRAYEIPTLVKMSRHFHSADPKDKIYALLGLLEMSQHFDSTDPRDKIYALQGLIKGHDGIITVNYDEPAARTYARVAKAFLESTLSLSLLPVAAAMRDRTYGIDRLPSWLPNYHAWGYLSSLKAPEPAMPAMQRAVASISLEQMTLCAETARLGRIDLTDRDRDKWPFDGGRDNLSRWLDIVLDHKDHLSRDGKSIHDKFFSILTQNARSNLQDWLQFGFMAEVGSLLRTRALASAFAGGVSDAEVLTEILKAAPRADEARPMPGSATEAAVAPGLYSIDLDRFFRFFRAWGITLSNHAMSIHYKRIVADRLRAVAAGTEIGGQGRVDDWQIKFSTEVQLDRIIFREAVSKTVEHKSLFITDSGHLGTSLQGVRPGDQVCLVRGCSLPLLIRPHGKHYEVIGQCYVPGMMDGEYDEETIERRLQWEMLEFR